MAQSASQITPPSFRPAATRSGGSIVFSGQPGLDTPEGADRLSVTLSGVAVVGDVPDRTGELAALKARLVGRRIPASEIFAAVRELEAAYARAGFVLMRVVLPAQTLKDGGLLKLAVVDGVIERVDYRTMSDRIKGRIAAVVEPLVGRRGLTLAEIERRLLIAGDTPGVALRSALKAGKTPGTTVLVLEPRYHALGSFVGFDNTLSGQLGRSQTTVGLDANSVLSQGELIYLRAAGHLGNTTNGNGGLVDEDPRVRTLAAGVVVPLGQDGLTFNLEAAKSRTTPKPAPGLPALQSYSTFDRVSGRLRYPWIRSRALTVSSELSFDIENALQGVLFAQQHTPVAKDRLRVLRLSSDAAYNTDTLGLVSGKATLSFGLPAFGARSGTAASFYPLSRTGSSPEFQKLEVAASYGKRLFDHADVALYARAQTSFNQALPQAEQIGFASFQELSTFNAGALGGDSGWVVRGEVSSPWDVRFEELQWRVAPYVFAATAGLSLSKPTAVEQATTRASSIGLGLRVLSAIDVFSQASVTIEFGRAYRDDGGPDSNRFTVVGAVRF
ncbi:ShlB/FhaC/HecB family hemolysin secretion/activation protein [uncultured Alsobacter sp.]|uniref:ShlB/FhaC/HecB family hemolysin secretion/activation protein n=1 Tax=uncultured Alsobacter sp. TaxID=1748258 RepID=UPI0025CD480F|nr:ShlB/FhaC/HecB family hemolysin secretion/activation protein [uncultured Alsobacter sp.]